MIRESNPENKLSRNRRQFKKRRIREKRTIKDYRTGRKAKEIGLRPRS